MSRVCSSWKHWMPLPAHVLPLEHLKTLMSRVVRGMKSTAAVRRAVARRKRSARRAALRYRSD
jgi:hypothetical protein